MNTRDELRRAFETLRNKGEVSTSEKWQATTPPDALFEIINYSFKITRMPESSDELKRETKCDYPWSENHFQERIAGEPTNPGVEYLNWPYYTPEKHDEVFRAEGEHFFSHTYQERFWPDKTLKGTGKMGYNLGDFNDLIARLKNDPGGRQAFYAIWHPQDSAENGVRLPCTIGYHFLIRQGKLNMTYLIRSCDIRRHFRNDIYMSIRLGQYVRDQIKDPVDKNLKMGEFFCWLGSLHCWDGEKAMLDADIQKFDNF